MTRKTVIALVLTGVTLIAATPSPAVERNSAATGNAWYGGAGHESPRQRSREPSVPDCAYPLNYDSGGAAIFQRYGCRLP
jgi:hypothetical protein